MQEAAAFRASPKAAVTIDGETENAVHAERLENAGIGCVDLRASEAGKASCGADPEHIIVSFSQRLNGGFRQAVGSAPETAGVLKRGC